MPPKTLWKVNRHGHGYLSRLERQKATQEILWQHGCELYCTEQFRSIKMCYLCKISGASILVEAEGSQISAVINYFGDLA